MAITPTTRRILALPTDEAVREIAVMSAADAATIVGELANLPRIVVQGDASTAPELTGVEREHRTALLLRDRTFVWAIEDVAAAAGLKPSAATKWRNIFLNNGGVASENALVAPDVPTARPYRQSGDPQFAPEGHPGYAAPMFYAGTGRTWLWQTERLDDDLYPREDSKGRKPPGAPRRRQPADELVNA